MIYILSEEFLSSPDAVIYGFFLAFILVTFAIILHELSDDGQANSKISNYESQPKYASSDIEPCEICGKPVKIRGAGERLARGATGAAGGLASGTIIGTLLLPGVGTIFGAAAGGYFGSSRGMQVSKICDSCCETCRKQTCICNRFSGYCACGEPLSMMDDGICNTCRESASDY